VEQSAHTPYDPRQQNRGPSRQLLPSSIDFRPYSPIIAGTAHASAMPCGGGGNSEVVTALKYQLHPGDQVLSGALTYPAGRIPELLHALVKFHAAAPDEMDAFAQLLPSVRQGSWAPGAGALGMHPICALYSLWSPSWETVLMLDQEKPAESQCLAYKPCARGTANSFAIAPPMRANAVRLPRNSHRCEGRHRARPMRPQVSCAQSRW